MKFDNNWLLAFFIILSNLNCLSVWILIKQYTYWFSITLDLQIAIDLPLPETSSCRKYKANDSIELVYNWFKDTIWFRSKFPTTPSCQFPWSYWWFKAWHIMACFAHCANMQRSDRDYLHSVFAHIRHVQQKENVEHKTSKD